MATPAPDSALIELPKKLRHENALARNLRSLFKEMSQIVELEIAVNGRPQNLVAFNLRMNELLMDAYRKTSKTFKQNLRQQLNLGRFGSQSIDDIIEGFIQFSVPDQTNFIMQTTNKEIFKITDDILALAQEEGENLTNVQLSKKVKKEFGRRNRVRSKIIAQTEVQNIAEESKWIEASVLQQTGKVNLMKRWDAVLDRRTRPFHAVADGQRRQIDEPFTVDNEQLQRPGDTSLGASAKNVINCRCSSQFITPE